MLNKFLNEENVILFIVCFISLVLFTGILKSLLYSIIILIVKHLFIEYLYDKIQPYIKKFIIWVESFKK